MRNREDGLLSGKMRKLGRVLRDAAIATVAMPLALIGVAAALALMMVLLW